MKEPYPQWLIDLVRDFTPREVPLDVTAIGTYQESTTKWGPNPVYEAVPADLRAKADEAREALRATRGTEQSRQFVDSNGCHRIGGAYGFNAFASFDDAERGARATLRPGSDFWVWQFADGLYDWTAIRDPKGPGYGGDGYGDPRATLIAHSVTSPRKKRDAAR